MLDIRPTCEHCNKSLPHDSREAMICSFECTFCKDCVTTVLQEVCPNCGGGFTPRPIRPVALLEKYPVSTTVVHKPVDVETHQNRLKEQRNHL